mgnify:FL=1
MFPSTSSRERTFEKTKLFPSGPCMPDINTRQVGRILDSYAKLSRILPSPLVFISGYANRENVFNCSNINV